MSVEPRPLAVVLLDLDHFKYINDVHGHAEGDRVLRAVAGALACSCRSGDPTFRIGGDEFAMLLHDADAEEATQIALRARAAVTRLDGRVGLSFGVASWPADADAPDGLLARADERLYEAKRAGRSRGPMPAARRQHERLAVASRLSLELAPLTNPAAIAERAVDELHRSFDFYLAVIQRLDGEILRVVGAAGPLASDPAFLAFEQTITEGVNGRVARTGAPALIADTRDDPDYLRRDPRTDPGSEVALPVFVDGRVWGVLNLEQVAPGALDADDLLLAEVVAAQVGAALHRVELTAEIERTVATTLSTLVDVLEAKDAYTAQHARDVVELSIRSGRRLGMDARALRDVRYAALLHDIGKIAVPSDLLRKPSRLTAEEFEQVKAHSEVGDRLLCGIPFLRTVAPLVRAIHERWDGSGYPDGLRGEDIPLGARVVGVCDALDAMVSDRPYRAALDTETALAELTQCAGTQFDPRVVAAVLTEVSARDRSRSAVAS
ncbi:MAG: HD domain-containing phosphohydrolase [Solirubrobacteraceae bacterium]